VHDMSKVIILVGGSSKGTRFRPLSLDIPKPLFPLAGKPNLYHQIEAATKIPKLIEVLLLGFYEDHLFTSFIKETSTILGVNIKYLREQKELGTAGGLLKFKREIMKGDPETIVLLHSDICSSFPLKEIVEFQLHHKQELTLVATRINREYASNYGCLVEDPETHQLVHYAEKPETFVSDLINCGMYCFSPAFLDYMGVRKEAHMRESGSETEVFRLEQDVIIPLVGSGRILVYIYNEFWRQIKNAGAAVYVNDLYTLHYRKIAPDRMEKEGGNIIGNVMIEPSAEIHPSARLGPNVYIGHNCKIGKGVRISQSILLDDVEIKDHAFLTYSILAKGCSVGPWARVEGIANPTPKLVVNKERVGSTILGTGTQVNGEVIIRNCIVMPQKNLGDDCYNEIIL